MRSTKAFFLGLGTAFFLDRVITRRRRPDHPAVVDDETIEQHVLDDALPAAGVSAEQIDIEVEDGVVTVQGAVEGSERADELVHQVARIPGVRDVAAMIRVSEQRAA